ncbi:MAG: imidazole glycerol phosphate synthase subunit HisH [Propionibacteriaceae bacterium]|nr:imidazole glycerol phosphate synthase subunit HisH [Propionibacteriaceae bacterium]
MTSVAILDYGSGNIHSATRAAAATGADVTVTSDSAVALAADGLIVPGVGAFAACMEQLHAIGGDDIIRTRCERGRPVFGICVGHQILFSRGVEHGIETDGVGVFPGVIDRLPTERLPHMGWNTIAPDPAASLLAQVRGERFYFVHSYAALDASDAPADAALTWCEHEDVSFIAAVEWGVVTSTQFHPEKSGVAGAALLRAWVDGLR